MISRGPHTLPIASRWWLGRWPLMVGLLLGMTALATCCRSAGGSSRSPSSKTDPMPPLTKFDRKARGLFTDPNPMDLPPGALLKADNCVISRKGIVTKRPGTNRYGTTLSAAGKAIGEYQGRKVVLDGTTLKYDSDQLGTWSPWIGNFAAPDATIQMHFQEAKKNLFFSTSKGIYKQDTLTGYPYRSGLPEPFWDQINSVTLPGTGNKWFTPGNQVAYRSHLVRTDGQGNLLNGPPSGRHVLVNVRTDGLSWTSYFATGVYWIRVTQTSHGFATNDVLNITNSSFPFLNGLNVLIIVVDPSTWDFNIGNTTVPPPAGSLSAGKLAASTLYVNLQGDERPGDVIDVYRTRLSGDSDADPGERYFKVFRHKLNFPAVTMAAAGTTVTVTHTAHGFTGSNYPVVMAEVSDPRFEVGPHNVTITGVNTYTYVVGVAPPATGTGFATGGYVQLASPNATIDTIADRDLGDAAYWNDTDEGPGLSHDRPPWAKLMALYRGHLFAANTLGEHVLNLRMTSQAFVTGVDTITIAGQTYTAVAAVANLWSEFQKFTTETTTAKNVAKTAQSLCAAINYNYQSSVRAEYVSGFNDAPGKILLRSRLLGGSSFAATVNVTATGNLFEPILPTAGITVSSKNDADPAVLFWSLQDRPEAMPTSNQKLIGKSGKKILGLVALAEALLIYKEDGLFILTGESDSLGGRLWVVIEKDPTLISVAPDSLVALDNSGHAVSTKGIQRSTTVSSPLVSGAIEADIIEILATNPNVSTLFCGIGYEAYHLYILGAPEFKTDTLNTIAWVWNYDDDAWTIWRRPIVAGLVSSVDGKFYFLHAQDPYVYQERKTFTRDDIQDETIAVTLTAVGTTVDASGATVSTCDLAWSYAYHALAKGDLVTQAAPAIQAKVNAVTSLGGANYRLTLDANYPTLTTGAQTVSCGYRMEVTWMESGGNPGAAKQFAEVQIYQERNEALHNELGFQSDTQDTTEFLSILSQGAIPPVEGVATPIRTAVPQDHQRATALRTTFRNDYCLEQVNLLQITYRLRFYGMRTARAPQ